MLVAPTSERPLGVVLCGGQSRRMGTDKATLVLDGRPLAARPVAALAGWDLEVVLAGARPELARAVGCRTHPDAHPGAGPVVALAGLADLRRDLVVLPCDLPFVDAVALEPLMVEGPPDVARLARRAGRPGYPIGWWSAATLARLDAAVGRGARSFDDALGMIDARPDWRDVDERLDDVDTPGDLGALGYPPGHD